jgi:hypothetical protein
MTRTVTESDAFKGGSAPGGCISEEGPQRVAEFSHSLGRIYPFAEPPVWQRRLLAHWAVHCLVLAWQQSPERSAAQARDWVLSPRRPILLFAPRHDVQHPIGQRPLQFQRLHRLTLQPEVDAADGMIMGRSPTPTRLATGRQRRARVPRSQSRRAAQRAESPGARKTVWPCCCAGTHGLSARGR